MTKTYNRINWQNEPSTDTPLNEQNLNKMDLAINVIDDRVIALDTSKADASDVLASFTGATYNEATGILTFTRANGTAVTIDTKLEKIAVNFSYNATTQKLVITLDDGTTQEIDLSALINEYDFTTSDTVAFTVENGKVKANIVDGSITEDKLQPNYLADIRVEVAKAEGAGAQADMAKSYAVGGTGTRAGEDTDNAKYYAEVAAAVARVDIATTSKAGIVKPDGTTITIDPDGTIHSAGGSGGEVAWDDVTGKPTTFTPSAHQHTKADITDLGKATNASLGLVKVDGDTIEVDDDGKISAQPGITYITKAEYDALGDSVLTDNKMYAITDDEEGGGTNVPIATNDTFGIVRPDGETIVINDGVISAVSTGSDEDWNLNGSTTGTSNRITLNDDHNEFLIVANYSDRIATLHIIRPELINGAYYFAGGAYASNNYFNVCFSYSASAGIKIETAISSGSNVATTTKLTIYGKK